MMNVDIQWKDITCPRLTFGPGRFTLKVPNAFNVISTVRILAFIYRVSSNSKPTQVLRGLVDSSNGYISMVLRDNSKNIRISAYSDGVDDSVSLWQA